MSEAYHLYKIIYKILIILELVLTKHIYKTSINFNIKYIIDIRIIYYGSLGTCRVTNIKPSLVTHAPQLKRFFIDNPQIKRGDQRLMNQPFGQA